MALPSKPRNADLQPTLPPHRASPFITDNMTPRQKIRWCTGLLLLTWALVSFGWVWFARDLHVMVSHWPLDFWIAAQGSILVFLLITVVNARCVNRWEKQAQADEHHALANGEAADPSA
jgi:putative solute:sodium symporter small subunit